MRFVVFWLKKCHQKRFKILSIRLNKKSKSPARQRKCRKTNCLCKIHRHIRKSEQTAARCPSKYRFHKNLQRFYPAIFFENASKNSPKHRLCFRRLRPATGFWTGRKALPQNLRHPFRHSHAHAFPQGPQHSGNRWTRTEDCTLISALLIQKSQKQDWNSSFCSVFNVVSKNIGIRNVFYLLAFFVFSTDFKCVFLVYKKITLLRKQYLVSVRKLIERKSFTDVYNSIKLLSLLNVF